MDGLKIFDHYNIPGICSKCGNVMIFKGVGEYQCEKCGMVEYDDYGKVRLYIESHKGATAAQIEEAIGVTQRSIRRMLKEGRIEISEGSRTFLHCEMCGKEIRSGQYCDECEINVHRRLEEQKRQELSSNKQGYGMGRENDEGQKRYIRRE